ncbi:MAG: domain S-box protein [Roseomonas sp.]|nr:domain S-box protein [Roseomonas sp.]
MVRALPLRSVGQILGLVLPTALLLLSLLLILYRLIEVELDEKRLLRLEAGLQTQQELADLLRQGAIPPVGAAAREQSWNALLRDSMEDMRRLADKEPSLQPQQRILLATVDAGLLPSLPPSAAAMRWMHEMADLTLQDIGRTLRREASGLRDHTRGRWRLSVAAALGLAVAGIGLLALRLRSIRREAGHHAVEADLAKAQMYAVYNAAPFGLALLDENLHILKVNPSFASIAATPAAVLAAQPFGDAVPALAQPLLPLLRHAQQAGTAMPGQEILIHGALDEPPRHFFVSAEPVPVTGGPPLLSLVVVDVTDRVAAEIWRGEAVAELNHRVKNTLATVQSLAAQTLRGAGHDPMRFAADFSARLSALSRSHELIAAEGWSATTVEQTVNAALLPWLSSGRLTVVGPAGLPLRAGQAQALVIALAELAGNATQHGALAGGGRVTLSWDVLPDNMVRLLWQERGGPRPPARPPHNGFGLRFLERGLPHDLGQGSWSALRFDVTGVAYEVCFLPHGMKQRAALSAGAAA